MTLSNDPKKRFFSLNELDSETYTLIKAYRDFRVMLTSGMINSLSVSRILQRFEDSDFYLKIFYLDFPLYNTTIPEDMRYLGSTIGFDIKAAEVYMFDLYFGVSAYKISFGVEKMLKNSLTVPADYDEKTDFKEVFDLIKNDPKANY